MIKPNAAKAFALIVFAALVWGCGKSEKSSSTANKPSGLEVVLEIDPTSLSVSQLSNIEGTRQDVRDVLDLRAKEISGEATVERHGSWFIVRLPGHWEPEKASARLLETSASPSIKRAISFHDAKTVTTGDGKLRNYDIGRMVEYKGFSACSFTGYMGTTIPPGTKEYRSLIAGWGAPIVKTEHIQRVGVYKQRWGDEVPYIRLAASGAARMEKWCRRISYVERQLACVVDGVVISIAPLKKGVVLKDEIALESNLSKLYVQNLAKSVRPALPAQLLVKKKGTY